MIRFKFIKAQVTASLNTCASGGSENVKIFTDVVVE